MAITAKQAIEAARGSRGFVTTIARQLACDRTHVYRLMDKFPTFKQAVADERESLKDFAEGKLFQQIDDGNTTAIIFYLKCQAKERGYVERQEITGADGGAVPIQVNGLDNLLKKAWSNADNGQE
jgi:hypothetical protein